MKNVPLNGLKHRCIFYTDIFTRVLSISFREIAEKLLSGDLKDMTILINLHYYLRVWFIGVRQMVSVVLMF